MSMVAARRGQWLYLGRTCGQGVAREQHTQCDLCQTFSSKRRGVNSNRTEQGHRVGWIAGYRAAKPTRRSAPVFEPQAGNKMPSIAEQHVVVIGGTSGFGVATAKAALAEVRRSPSLRARRTNYVERSFGVATPCAANVSTSRTSRCWSGFSPGSITLVSGFAGHRASPGRGIYAGGLGQGRGHDQELRRRTAAGQGHRGLRRCGRHRAMAPSAGSREAGDVRAHRQPACRSAALGNLRTSGLSTGETIVVDGRVLQAPAVARWQRMRGSPPEAPIAARRGGWRRHATGRFPLAAHTTDARDAMSSGRNAIPAVAATIEGPPAFLGEAGTLCIELSVRGTAAHAARRLRRATPAHARIRTHIRHLLYRPSRVSI